MLVLSHTHTHNGRVRWARPLLLSKLLPLPSSTIYLSGIASTMTIAQFTRRSTRQNYKTRPLVRAASIAGYKGKLDRVPSVTNICIAKPSFCSGNLGRCSEQYPGKRLYCTLGVLAKAGTNGRDATLTDVDFQMYLKFERCGGDDHCGRGVLKSFRRRSRGGLACAKAS